MQVASAAFRRTLCCSSRDDQEASRIKSNETVTTGDAAGASRSSAVVQSQDSTADADLQDKRHGTDEKVMSKL